MQRIEGTGRCIPQSELPVAGGVAVPVGQWLHPALEPRALADEGGERWHRHGCDDSTAVRRGRGGVLPSIAVWRVEMVRLSWERKARDRPGVARGLIQLSPPRFTREPGLTSIYPSCGTTSLRTPPHYRNTPSRRRSRTSPDRQPELYSVLVNGVGQSLAIVCQSSAAGFPHTGAPHAGPPQRGRRPVCTPTAPRVTDSNRCSSLHVDAQFRAAVPDYIA